MSLLLLRRIMWIALKWLYRLLVLLYLGWSRYYWYKQLMKYWNLQLKLALCYAVFDVVNYVYFLIFNFLLLDGKIVDFWYASVSENCGVNTSRMTASCCFTLMHSNSALTLDRQIRINNLNWINCWIDRNHPAALQFWQPLSPEPQLSPFWVIHVLWRTVLCFGEKKDLIVDWA